MTGEPEGTKDSEPPPVELNRAESATDAKEEFARWLAHPHELGRRPDELEVIDTRVLPWPPGEVPRRFWLIKYVLRDTTGLAPDNVGIGLVGSRTFCLFSYRAHERPPEDAYAIHLFWELRQEGLITLTPVEATDADPRALLETWSGAPLEEARVLYVAEVSKHLMPSRGPLALAAGACSGERGWAVIDGPGSAWYPASDLPKMVPESVLLGMHIGRKLLGFTSQPSLREYLAPALKPPDSTRVIEAYEKLLSAAREAPGEDSFDSFGPLGRHFDAYVDALVKTGRAADIRDSLESLAPHWDHNSGYGALGSAAFRAGLFEQAERFLLRLRESYEQWHRSKDMDLLARVWKRQGQENKALQLLLDCLRKTAEESKSATGSDRKLFEKWFQQHRAAYLELFPSLGQDVLKEHGVPETTLR